MKRSIKTFTLSFCLLLTTAANSTNIGTESDAAGFEKLQKIHSELRLIHGSFNEEFPEQLMTAIHLPNDAKVLEIGANVGRNSCVIAKILNNSQNLVSLESNPDYIHNLKENRNSNHLQFHIEPSALSKRPLMQNGWVTIPGSELLPGYFKVNTITFTELQKKYHITFDTLVADCEGALFYILQDEPTMLDNINLIIIENDYPNPNDYNFVSFMFKKKGFKLVYQKNYYQKLNFYQVWKR